MYNSNNTMSILFYHSCALGQSMSLIPIRMRYAQNATDGESRANKLSYKNLIYIGSSFKIERERKKKRLGTACD